MTESTKRNICIGFIVALLLALGVSVYLNAQQNTQAPNDNTTPLPVGNQNPRPTNPPTNTPSPTPSEPTAEDPEPNQNVSDLIVVTSPTSGQEVKSPITITGRARGNWFFEATFPIQVFDSKGKKIGEGYAEAQGDWMTTNWVPFTATITLNAPDTSNLNGTIVLKNSNASGLPENDKQLVVPVKFDYAAPSQGL